MARRPRGPAGARRRRCGLTRLALAALLLALAPAAAGAVAPALPGFSAGAVVSGLDQPTAAAFAPDGRLFILEKAGRVRVWSPAAGLAPEPVLSLPSCTASEMGLLGLAFAPAFDCDGHLFLYHTQPPGGDVRRCAEGSGAGRRNRVVRVTVAGDRADPASLVEILGGFRTDNGNHDGGCLRIGPDGFLYVAVGDSGRGDAGAPGQATNPYARDLDSPEGKLLRLALDGRPAPGNPFLGGGGARDYVFASGLRNPFRFAFDSRTGLLWLGDVGQSSFEEISIARAGDDLGWPLCEGREPSPPCPGATTPPVHVYPHGADGASVTGGVFYDGAQFDPAFRGDYFFGDFVFDLVWRARLDAARTGFAAQPEVFLREANGPVDFAVGPDGALYVVALKSGSVLRVAQEAPVVGPDACARALLAATPRLVRQAGRRRAACAGGCPAPRLPARVRRTVARACGTPPPAPACAALGCVPCGTAQELTRCLAAAAAGVATQVIGATPRGNDRCARRLSGIALGTAAARLDDVARCAETGAGDCLAPRCPAPPALPRACRPPSPEACGAFACVPCGGEAELAACVARTAEAPAATLARALLGR